MQCPDDTPLLKLNFKPRSYSPILPDSSSTCAYGCDGLVFDTMGVAPLSRSNNNTVTGAVNNRAGQVNNQVGGANARGGGANTRRDGANTRGARANTRGGGASVRGGGAAGRGVANGVSGANARGRGTAAARGAARNIANTQNNHGKPFFVTPIQLWRTVHI